ncbi:DUF3104 domain-containing protein [Synechococcus sp. UW179A]|uniref:DUF3104 domain-containing protein n=1 Tax=Synechococcus sp. UW179A TaxID=2575510 RepID=UPI002110B642|nr:DUF3104 domain-containing protein [Synechococcus sp. UW179A]
MYGGGAARDPKIHNLFQIADVDSSEIKWDNADLGTRKKYRFVHLLFTRNTLTSDQSLTKRSNMRHAE